jgi:SAM-dependent methyltransferase
MLHCDACGTEFLSPQPDDDRLADIYGPNYYLPWSSESQSNVVAMKQKTFSRALNLVGPTPTNNVLELGSATGDFAELAVRLGLQFFGIDLNHDACISARSRVPDGSFHIGTLKNHPLDNVDFSLVVMFDFLEHVRDPRAELRSLYSLLSEGGKVLISTPDSTSFSRKVLRKFWPQYREEHLVLCSKTGLVDLLEDIGFTVVSASMTKKYVTLNYLLGQLQAFPVPILTQLISSIWRFIPLAKSKPIGFYFGEMTIVAQRK